MKVLGNVLFVLGVSIAVVWWLFDRHDAAPILAAGILSMQGQLLRVAADLEALRGDRR